MESKDFEDLTPEQAITSTAELLATVGITNAEQDARTLVGIVRAGSELIPFTPMEAATLVSFIERRMRHEPLAYLAGRTSFMGRDFAVDSRAHIPRPAMEVVVREAVQAAGVLIDRYSAEEVAVVDVGTGCAALAIMLALLDPRLSRIYAVDIATEALEVARSNLVSYHIAERVRLLQGDLLHPLPEKVRLIIANLPFVARAQAPELAPGVQEYEPSISVFGEDDGWGIQRRLVSMAPEHLLPGSVVMVTFQVRQEPQVQDIVAQIFPRASTSFVTIAPNWSKLVRIET